MHEVDLPGLRWSGLSLRPDDVGQLLHAGNRGFHLSLEPTSIFWLRLCQVVTQNCPQASFCCDHT